MCISSIISFVLLCKKASFVSASFGIHLRLVVQWSLGLSVVLHDRFISHPCRTYDPENADIFYIPYLEDIDAKPPPQAGLGRGNNCKLNWLYILLTQNGIKTATMKRRSGKFPFIFLIIIYKLECIYHMACERGGDENTGKL